MNQKFCVRQDGSDKDLCFSLTNPGKMAHISLCWTVSKMMIVTLLGLGFLLGILFNADNLSTDYNGNFGTTIMAGLLTMTYVAICLVVHFLFWILGLVLLPFYASIFEYVNGLIGFVETTWIMTLFFNLAVFIGFVIHIYLLYRILSDQYNGRNSVVGKIPVNQPAGTGK